MNSIIGAEFKAFSVEYVTTVFLDFNETICGQEKFRIADADGNGKLEGEDAEKKGGVEAVLGASLKMDLKVKADVILSMGLGQ